MLDGKMARKTTTMLAKYVVYWLKKPKGKPLPFGLFKPQPYKFRARDIRVVGNYQSKGRAITARDNHNRNNAEKARIAPRFVNETAEQSIVRQEEAFAAGYKGVYLI